MQMTMDQASRPGLMLAFALKRRGGYVMRSEKRPGYGGNGGGNRGRKPRRPKAGAPYIALTLLVSILLWPLGMVMLWRRKVRMQAGTKLLLSLLTLCLSIFLIVFALTVPVNNEKITGYQDKANDWLDKTAAQLAVVGDAAYHKGAETWTVMTGFAEKTWRPAIMSAADGIDKGVEWTGVVKAKIGGLFRGKPSPEGDIEPDVTPGYTGGETLNAHLPEQSPAPDSGTPLEAGMLTADGALKRGEAPEPTPEATPTAEPTATEEAEPTDAHETPAATGGEAEAAVGNSTEAGKAAKDDAEAEKAAIDSGEAEKTPDDGDKAEEPAAAGDSGKAEKTSDNSSEAEKAAEASEAPAPETSEAPAPEASEAPAPEASEAPASEASAEPTPTPQPELTVKPMAAAEAIVYFKPTSKQYHMASSCGNMTDAEPHTLREAVAAGKQPCKTCGTPDGTIMNVTYVAWVDENSVFHTRTDCTSFSGQWRLMPLSAAVSGGLEPCPACEAALYARHFGPSGLILHAPDGGEASEAESAPAAETESTAAPEAQPEAEPEATDTPAPSIIRPAVALKAAGDATVYHSGNGKFYHKVQICKGMTGSSPYRLSDIKGQYRRCRTCDAPEESLIGQPCLWMDENGLCHTYDACEAFKGSYTLVPRDQALAEGRTGCTACGANEYLIPGTVLAAD